MFLYDHRSRSVFFTRKIYPEKWFLLSFTLKTLCTKSQLFNFFSFIHSTRKQYRTTIKQWRSYQAVNYWLILFEHCWFYLLFVLTKYSVLKAKDYILCSLQGARRTLLKKRPLQVNFCSFVSGRFLTSTSAWELL